MKLKALVDAFALAAKCAPGLLDREVGGAYVSDLLSDVIAHARAGDVWITLQLHENIVAVACMKELAGIIIINDREPGPATLYSAEEEGIPIMVSELSAFELAGELYQFGLRGREPEQPQC